jgi:hypothetical protein
MLAAPEVGMYLTDIHRLTDQAEQLPKNVAAERQAILVALDERMKMADATVANVRAAVSEANGLVASLGPTSLSLNEMLKTADALFTRFDAWDRWATTRGSHPFDIREYTEGVKELAVTAGTMNDMFKSSNDLLGSSEWDRRIEQVNQSVDGRIKMAAGQSQRLVDDVFWRTNVMLGALGAILIFCLAIAFVLMRRLIKRLASNTAELRSECGHPAGQETGPGPAREARVERGCPK